MNAVLSVEDNQVGFQLYNANVLLENNLRIMKCYGIERCATLKNEKIDLLHRLTQASSYYHDIQNTHVLSLMGISPVCDYSSQGCWILLKPWSFHLNLSIPSIFLLVQTGRNWVYSWINIEFNSSTPFILHITYYFSRIFFLISHEPVLKKGEHLLKKNASIVNLEDQNLITRLFILFNGMEH